MLQVLGDIELAQTMKKEKEKAVSKDVEEVPHPIDVDYGLLKAKLTLVDPKSNEFKVIKCYFLCITVIILPPPKVDDPPKFIS